MARTSFLIEPWMAKHSGTCWLCGLCHNWNMTVLTLSISWMDPHATITVMLGTSLTRHCHIDGLEEQSTILWPPRSPDLTPCDFFLWGYVKDNAYKSPLPQNVWELQDRIRAVVQTIDGNMLKRVWQELTLSYWHLQSKEGRSHWAFVNWFLLVNNLDTYITYVWNCILFWQLISKIYQI